MDTTHPLVSIIIISYNIEDFIEEAIYSCFEQDYSNIELICIDDGSTDSTYEKIKRLAQGERNIKRIKTYKKDNGGPNSARKEGVKHAAGKYVFFMDGDDMIPPSAISSLIKKHNDHPYDTIIGDYKIAIYNNNTEKIYRYNFTNDCSGIKALETYLYSPKALWGKLFKRSLFTNNELNYALELKIGEDSVLMTQLLYYSQKVTACHDITYIYKGKRTESLYAKYGQDDNYTQIAPSYMYISQFLRTKDISNNPTYFSFFHSYIYRYLLNNNNDKENRKVIKTIINNITYKSLPNSDKTTYMLYFLLRINISFGRLFLKLVEFYGNIRY